MFATFHQSVHQSTERSLHGSKTYTHIHTDVDSFYCIADEVTVTTSFKELVEFVYTLSVDVHLQNRVNLSQKLLISLEYTQLMCDPVQSCEGTLVGNRAVQYNRDLISGYSHSHLISR